MGSHNKYHVLYISKMGRLRIVPDGNDKFQIFLPGENEGYPIGSVTQIPLSNPPKWKIKAFFITLMKDNDTLAYRFDDSVEGARALKDLFHRTESFSLAEKTEPYTFIFPDDLGSD